MRAPLSSPFSPPKVTTVVTSFVFRLVQSVGVASFMQQLLQLGYLVHWESLLSTHGDEIGMLEDFIVAIHDLNMMAFKVTPPLPSPPSSPALPVASSHWLTASLHSSCSLGLAPPCSGSPHPAADPGGGEQRCEDNWLPVNTHTHTL